MAITVDWPTKTFSIPQGDLAPIVGTLYELDTESVFRQGVNALMASEEGIVFDDPISHNTEYTVTGVTYGRKIELVNGYKVKFTPDDQWSVRLVGSNNNLFDVENGALAQNQVQVIAQNSAGLVRAVVTEQDKTEIAAASAASVWDEDLTQHSPEDSASSILKFLRDIEGGRWYFDGSQMVFCKADNVTEVARFNMKDAAGQPVDTSGFSVHDRERVGS
jgi:hypothetical protein